MYSGVGHGPASSVHLRRESSHLEASTSYTPHFAGRPFVGRQHRHRRQDVHFVDDGERQRFIRVCEHPQYPPHEMLQDELEVQKSRSGGLEQQTYEFYQQMAPHSVDEAFLWGRLEGKLGYLTEAERNKVQEALFLAYDAHAGQMRKSGEPFISHPVEVTRILAELKSEPDTLIAGLLHDTVEDTDLVSLAEIEQWFGHDCARIVEGETKFSKLSQLQKPSISKEDLQAIDLQQLFLAMTEDARIIIVKLADRLHNMRTMGSMPAEKQKKIGLETLAMFAPLASLLGLYSIKTELEDLSMKYCMPGLYNLIETHRNELIANQDETLLEAKKQLEASLRADVFLAARCESIDVIPTYRSIYSIYKRVKQEVQKKMPHVPLNGVPLKRMQQLIKGHNVLNEVNEIAQLSVVITEHQVASARNGLFFTSPVQLCYQVLGVLHSVWAPVPGSIKDFISTPKRNGYQGLHTCLLPLGCRALIPLEVHVRTASMQELANYGIAADAWALKPAPIDAPAPRGDAPRAVQRRHAGGAAAADGRPAAAAPHAALLLPSQRLGLDAAGPAPPPGWDPVKTAQLLQQAMHAVRCHNGAGPPGAAAAVGSSSGTGSSNGSSAGHGNGTGPMGRGLDAGAAQRRSGEDFTQLVLERYTAPSNGAASAQQSNGSSLGRAPSSNGAERDAAKGGAITVSATVLDSSPNGADSHRGSANGATGALRASDEGAWGLGRRTPGAPGGKLGKAALERRVNWLNSIREWQQEFLGTLSAQEFVQCIREDLLSQTVFVFTPLGDIMRLPMGATVVDFAYHVHSEVGNTMVAAKVNGRPVHPGYELCNADVVEVVQYEHIPRAHREHTVHRHKAWLNHAKTRSARYKLNKFIKEQEAEAAAPCAEAEAAGEPAAGNGGADAGASTCTTWLVVECEDRAGILAEVATQISLHGLNIQAYSGSTPDQMNMGLISFMNFQLVGDKARLHELCDKISKISAVQSWSVGGASPDTVKTFDAQDFSPS